MASGKKNYFRHSSNARKDDKIMDLIINNGKEAYFHFFVLLELCANQAAGDFPEDSKFSFHRRTLCDEWMVSNSKLDHHLAAIQRSLGVEYLLAENKVELLLPKLREYMGKYETKNTSNTPNKEINKEIKEIKENKLAKPTDQNEQKTISEKANMIAEIWNEAATQAGFVKTRVPLNEKRIESMREAISEFPKSEDWFKIIEQVAYDDFNLGKNDRGWKADFEWLFRKTKRNYLKLWEKYESQSN